MINGVPFLSTGMGFDLAAEAHVTRKEMGLQVEGVVEASCLGLSPSVTGHLTAVFESLSRVPWVFPAK